MTAVAAAPQPPPLALVQALEQLGGPLDQLDAPAQLQAIEDVSRGPAPPAAAARRQLQTAGGGTAALPAASPLPALLPLLHPSPCCPPFQACTALVTLVEGGGRLPTDLLENALEAVARGLAAARQQLEAAAGQLAAARRGGWACALLAAADACMHSEAWHAAWHADAGGGTAAYKRTVELARDMLRQDLLPLLADASAQQGVATGFCLAPQYRALLGMGALPAWVLLGAGPAASWLLACLVAAATQLVLVGVRLTGGIGWVLGSWI